MISQPRFTYSDHARLSRELAARLTDGDAREHLFEMADLYERLAVRSAREPARGGAEFADSEAS